MHTRLDKIGQDKTDSDKITRIQTKKKDNSMIFCCLNFRFAKNLSHDQINLSTLKGEGELKNLELNEEVLTELLELPSWLRLSRATCNRVAVRIQWTKLKSVPIHLSLDEVNTIHTIE